MEDLLKRCYAAGFGDRGRATSQGMHVASRSWKWQKIDSPPGSEEIQPRASISDFWPPELSVRGYICGVLSHKVCGNFLQQQQEINPGVREKERTGWN